MPKAKEDKQKEAIERQTAHAALSTQEKIAKLEARGITSGKEYKKLKAQLTEATA
jgi:uncharacterized protein YoaH (UPF0181 family)